MNQRPPLNKNLDSKTFRDFYYLKEELVNFCRNNNLPISGGKLEIVERIAYFLDTGKLLSVITKKKKTLTTLNIYPETIIEADFICSEKHRAFFKEHIGSQFSFNVTFQKWLKTNHGKTYQDAINAYYQIMKDKKNRQTVIDKQFEYNTYIREFFIDNKGKSLEDAIKCWKYKKALPGHNHYEKSDLVALD